jgi:molybdopterin synthase sulfur carrier subunit
MPRVFIPPMMQRLTGGVETVQVEGATIRQVIEAVERLYPGTKAWLCEGDGLRPGVAAAIDGEIAAMGLLTKVPDGSEVHFIPALGGGRRRYVRGGHLSL